jgi:hypothetical protein
MDPMDNLKNEQYMVEPGSSVTKSCAVVVGKYKQAICFCTDVNMNREVDKCTLNEFRF